MTNIRDLSLGDHELIGHIIGRSFADDPVNQWVFRNVSGIMPFYKRMAKKLYLNKGFGHVSEDGTGGALWLPPGISKDIPVRKNLDIIASMLWHGGITSLKNGLDIDALLLKHKPGAPHYYLFAIGSLPENQGQGIGSRVIEAGLKIADDAEMPAYLESSKYSNVPFYQRYGFEVMEKVSVAPDSPPLWLMWRPARDKVAQ